MKELWIAAFEELVCKYVDEGLDDNAAEKKAEENMDWYWPEYYGNLIDQARMMRKDYL